jgi:hypothetical protein
MDQIPNIEVYFAENVALNDGHARDYRLVAAEADTWLTTYTFKKPVKLDLVVRLWDEGGRELLGTVDEHFPRYDEIDSAMYHWVSESRTYCVETLEYGDWAGFSTGGDGSTFTLGVSTPERFWNDPDAIEHDAGDNDDVANAQPLPYTLASPSAVVLGTFDSETDRDVYVLTAVDHPGFPKLGFYLAPPGRGGDGMVGFGADGSPSQVSLVASDGVTVLAQRSPEDQASSCEYDNALCAVFIDYVPGETYYLVVERDPSRPLTGNDAYSIFISSLQLGVIDTETVDDGANDTALSATEMTLGDLDGNLGHLFEGTLPDGDVDWWLMPDSGANEHVAVRCGSAFHGSGVEGFTVEAFAASDPNAAPIQSEVESPDSLLAWWPTSEPKGTPSMAPLAGGSDYYIKLSATGSSSTVTSRYYYCQVIRFPADS